MDMNKVWILGTVFREPKSFAEGKVASFTLATSKTVKTKEGATRYENAYHNCAAFGGLAEKVMAEVQDRSRVAVEGEITQEKKERPDGTSVTYHGIKIEKLHIFPVVDLPEETGTPRKRRATNATPKAVTLEEAEERIAKNHANQQPVQMDVSIDDLPF